MKRKELLRRQGTQTHMMTEREQGEQRGESILGKKRSCMWEGPELGEIKIYSRKVKKCHMAGAVKRTESGKSDEAEKVRCRKERI